MCDVFARTKFARPLAGIQLPCGVCRYPPMTYLLPKKDNLIQPYFEFTAKTNRKSKTLVDLNHRIDRYFARDTWWPIVAYRRVPPPFISPSGPRDALVRSCGRTCILAISGMKVWKLTAIPATGHSLPGRPIPAILVPFSP